MGVNEEIAKAFGAHGLWKTRLKQAINTGQSEHDPDVVSRDDRCAFGKWLHGSDLSPELRDSSDYQAVVGLHADFHREAGAMLRKALGGGREKAHADLEGGTFAKVAASLARALTHWQRNAASTCGMYKSSSGRSLCFAIAGRLSLRIWATIAIPSLIALLLLAYEDYRQVEVLLEMRRLQEVVDVVVETAAVVHELQKERGLSAAYAAKPGERLAADRKAQLAVSDQHKTAFAAVAARVAKDVGKAMNEHLAAAADGIEETTAMRRKVDAGQAKPAEVVSAYSRTIGLLLTTNDTALTFARNPEVRTQVSAFSNLSHAKEYAGIERAVGAAAIGTGAIAGPTRKRLIELAEGQEQRLAQFSMRLTPAQKQAFEETMRDGAVAAFAQARASLIEGEIANLTAESWFSIATARIDLFKRLEDRMPEDLRATAEDVLAGNTRVLLVFNIVALVAGLVGTVVVILFSRGIMAPLGRLTSAMRALAEGQVNIEIPAVARADEVGEMARAVLVFQQQSLSIEQMTAEQNQQRVKAEEEKRRAIAEFAEEIRQLADRARAGDLSARLELDGREGELLAVSRTLNNLVATVEAGLNEIITVLSAMAEGDLTHQVVGEYEGAFQRLKDSSNTMAARLSGIVGEIVGAAGAVQTATAEIADGTGDLASRTEQQASNLEETAAAMEELTATVRQNADNARQASQLSTAAREAAETGGGIVAEAVGAMSRISGSSGKISEIVSMIDEIAFQTNLLALNAAVEAARAGDAGKGFAVVASEVRALAQRSSSASKEIKALIDNSSDQVRDGVRLVNRTGETLKEIVTSVKRVADIVAEIASASQEQATGLDEVNSAVTNMDDMTQQNAALVEETTAAAQSLKDQANGLTRLVGFFKTGAETTVPAVPG